ncbi:MAG: helix-turn-helix domain-containing protein [Paraburkholderia tropica]|uniref:HxlR family transcriptional regulator n=1 Tax=Paraburkholderia tropica TaxID=92647 RepID=A0ABX5MIZ1_9BURK|nr:helix-turn-helix domain-containing protein [Paraburkholderia tropica]PXX12538.1 HxlR family transcriptional regulator [Paraburkholderia tropica]PZW76515.1 HxlR family transcriptional regulator [Paraburkholderia tropica]
MRPTANRQSRADEEPVVSCAPHDVLTHLGDKWTILVLSMLAQAPENRARFSEIKYGVLGISQRMLTLTLRILERNGLVSRHYFPEVPPRVEYQLTSMGKSMLHPIEIFTGWIKENWPAMEQARRDYDAAANVSN